MRRALAAGLLSCALAAHAQAPPEPASPVETQPAPLPERPAAQNPAEAAPPAAEGTGMAAEPPAHPPQASAPRPPPPKPPAPAVTENPQDAQLAALRAEVNRLQSELDAERAAALPAPEESAPAQAARRSWEWLLLTAVLALTAGFFLGWRLLDRRIRRKYGGLRIY